MAKRQNKARLGRVGRVEREQRMNKIIQTIMIVVIALVAIVVLGGLVFNKIVIPNKVIATVLGEEITVGEFQSRTQFQRAQLVAEHDIYYQLMMQSTDSNVQNQYYNVIYQYQYQLDPEYLGDSVINEMIDEIILIQEAKARGIEITEDEVWETLYNAFGYYPNGYPTSTPAPTGDSAEDTEAETAVTPRPEPTSVTLDEYKQSLDEYLAEYRQYGADEDLLFTIIEAQLYRDALSEVLSEGVSNEADQVWARHILVTDLETAESVLERLDAGETWEDLALELSLDTSNSAEGGDLGWFTEGTMVQAFNDAAFAGEVGEIVGPVETDYGFHLIEILGHEMRPLEDAAFQERLSLAVDDLISEAKTAANEEGTLNLIDDWKTYIPTKPSSVYMTQ